MSPSPAPFHLMGFTGKRVSRGVAALFATFLITACGAERGPVVTTPQGSVQGIVADQVHVFRNIPYAAAPVGELRWRYPQPPANWEGVRDATTDGPICEQPVSDGNGNNLFLQALTDGAGYSAFNKWLLTTGAGFAPSPVMSEDCLSLTVRSPDLTGKLPVMVWIHGGGHRFGSGNEGFSDSNALAELGVVQVAINYRLGIWGFFAHPELVAEDPNASAGNYGLLDQIEALKWVQANIAAYGGDPDNVTIFGESAGGHSVGQIIASPLARGLVHGAIAQSGTGTYQMQHLHHQVEAPAGTEAGLRFAALAGIGGSDQLTQLRALSVERIRELENLEPILAATYHPQVDGWALPATASEIFATGQQSRVPIMLGSNSDEGTVLGQMIPFSIDGLLDPRPTTADAWDDYLEQHIPQLAAEYAADTDANVDAQHYRLLGDTLFGRHAYDTAIMLAQHAPTYLYFYERTPASADQTIGATHALELQHIYNRFLPLWPKDERDDSLAMEMGAYWTNFAKTKNPNAEGLPQWPQFDAALPQELALGHEATQARAVARRSIYEGLSAQQQMRIARATEARATGGQ